MQDMRKIGAYISALRKQKDMTQVELADMLNISHQAVSSGRGANPCLMSVYCQACRDIQ